MGDLVGVVFPGRQNGEKNGAERKEGREGHSQKKKKKGAHHDGHLATKMCVFYLILQGKSIHTFPGRGTDKERKALTISRIGNKHAQFDCLHDRISSSGLIP
jgi:hypothetical protein